MGFVDFFHFAKMKNGGGGTNGTTVVQNLGGGGGLGLAYKPPPPPSVPTDPGCITTPCTAPPAPSISPGEKFATFLADEMVPRNYPPTKRTAPYRRWEGFVGGIFSLWDVSRFKFVRNSPHHFQAAVRNNLMSKTSKITGYTVAFATRSAFVERCSRKLWPQSLSPLITFVAQLSFFKSRSSKPVLQVFLLRAKCLIYNCTIVPCRGLTVQQQQFSRN